jgi:hypothetical protein
MVRFGENNNQEAVAASWEQVAQTVILGEADHRLRQNQMFVDAGAPGYAALVNSQELFFSKANLVFVVFCLKCCNNHNNSPAENPTNQQL